jgi:hypothetical protein
MDAASSRTAKSARNVDLAVWRRFMGEGLASTKRGGIAAPF